MPDTSGRSPLDLAALCDRIGPELAAARTRPAALGAVSRLAATTVPGAECASITERRPERFVTVAATDDAARDVDEMQYAAGDGPCVDAIVRGVPFRTGHLDGDSRWTALAPGSAGVHGIRSVLSLPLSVDGDRRMGVNLYSGRGDAFGDGAENVAVLVASHGALAVAAATARERVHNLWVALDTNREIAMAVGVVMAKRDLDRDEAFGLLRAASQDANRKLADIAAAVLGAGGAAVLAGLPEADGGRRRSPGGTAHRPRGQRRVRDGS